MSEVSTKFCIYLEIGWGYICRYTLSIHDSCVSSLALWLLVELPLENDCMLKQITLCFYVLTWELFPRFINSGPNYPVIHSHKEL